MSYEEIIDNYSPDQIYCEHTRLEFYALLLLLRYQYHIA